MTPRLTRLAGALRFLVWLSIALVLLLPTLNWLLPDLPGGPALARHASLAGSERLFAWAIAMPPYLVAAIGLAQLALFCQRLRARGAFTREAAVALSRLGWSLMAAALLLPLSRFALGAYLAPLAEAAGRPMVGVLLLLAIGLGFLFGLVFVVFAAVLREATTLAEENASFV
jgi:hypothetical protein